MVFHIEWIQNYVFFIKVQVNFKTQIGLVQYDVTRTFKNETTTYFK